MLTAIACALLLAPPTSHVIDQQDWPKEYQELCESNTKAAIQAETERLRLLVIEARKNKRRDYSVELRKLRQLIKDMGRPGHYIQPGLWKHDIKPRRLSAGDMGTLNCPEFRIMELLESGKVALVAPMFGKSDSDLDDMVASAFYLRGVDTEGWDYDPEVKEIPGPFRVVRSVQVQNSKTGKITDRWIIEPLGYEPPKNDE